MNGSPHLTETEVMNYSHADEDLSAEFDDNGSALAAMTDDESSDGERDDNNMEEEEEENYDNGEMSARLRRLKE